MTTERLVKPCDQTRCGGVIHMTSRRLRHRTDEPGDREIPLDPGRPGIAVSELLHQFDPDGRALFFVEFHRNIG